MPTARALVRAYNLVNGVALDVRANGGRFAFIVDASFTPWQARRAAEAVSAATDAEYDGVLSAIVHAYNEAAA